MSLSPLRRTSQRARMLDGIERLRGTGRVEFGHSQEALPVEPGSYRITESGDRRVTEAGDSRVTE